MHAKKNWEVATQGEYPSHKPRVLLAKSCVSPSYWSSHSRNERQALITGGSLPRSVSSSNKTTGINQRRPRLNACGVQKRSNQQERLQQRDVAVEKTWLNSTRK